MKTTATKAKASTGAFSLHFTQQCFSCDGHVRSVRREFSDQAWAALVAWKEIPSKAVDAALCNDCYFNFRDVLIERADEMSLLASNVAGAAAVSQQNNAARA